MNTVTIYALVDPDTHQLRYVGRTQQSVKRRFKQHISLAQKGVWTLHVWIRSLHPRLPFLVILQEGIIEEYVHTTRKAKYKPVRGWTTGQLAETKWMKRFERSPLLCGIPRGSLAYNWLVNPPVIKSTKKRK